MTREVFTLALALLLFKFFVVKGIPTVVTFTSFHHIIIYYYFLVGGRAGMLSHLGQRVILLC